MIYIIVTTCIFNDCSIRKKQYITAISKLKLSLKEFSRDYKIIIVENNGIRNTFLNESGCEVHYTNNNSLCVTNKGYKELKDILDTIDLYKIKDSDFIVKMTGRYILKNNSEFMKTLNDLNTETDCIIKYGSYYDPVDYKTKDCITGLIGMKCCFIKQIKFPQNNDPLEWNWANVTYIIDDEKIHKVNKLGIWICPGGNKYFLV